MTELDVWRSAHILMKRYHTEAVLIATKRAEALLEQSDREGFLTWIRIAKAITDLERKSASNREMLH